ncbi:TonB family protein [Mucilaginibacter celer]|uniref:TonB family protein n=1 Tax=Mucilaginibacter celer TaxID=2305508 RepID=A0A494W3G8_9SPHI|nr:TonB family protein [Mucilaginibacter celer]AYL98283.1 TonB family protein [Mucilaginibacter celer]
MLKAGCIYIALFLTAGLAAAQQPAFKGGQQALNDFLKAGIVYPEYSRQNCIAGTVNVSFKLTKEGVVHDATVQQGPGIDLDDEALRVINLTSGQWTIPAGYNFNTVLIQPIRFDPDPARCGPANIRDMESAIAGYKAQQALENAVTNYYINKYKGTADTTKEAIIIGLKKQLGYDDDFVSDLLSQANEKFKQGDKPGACRDWNFIRNIGSNKADNFINKYCAH